MARGQANGGVARRRVILAAFSLAREYAKEPEAGRNLPEPCRRPHTARRVRNVAGRGGGRGGARSAGSAKTTCRLMQTYETRQAVVYGLSVE
jgi:hypothetical protein